MSHGFLRIATVNARSLTIESCVMAGSPVPLKYSEITDKIIGVFYDVYNELGHGFLESTYAEAMLIALEETGLAASREVSVPVWFRAQKVGQYFADFLVENSVLLKLKATRGLEAAHQAQLLHYLRATSIEVGLLLNFGVRPQFRRLLFDNERKKIRENRCESVARILA